MKNPDEVTDAELEREIMRPPRTFKGVELWPWGRTAKALWFMVLDFKRDSGVFQALSMIEITRKKGGASAAEDYEKHVIPLAYDQNKFRAKIFNWRDELTEDDEVEAVKIYDEILQLEYASRSVTQKEPGSKKSPPTSPRKSAIGSISSTEKAGSGNASSTKAES